MPPPYPMRSRLTSLFRLGALGAGLVLTLAGLRADGIVWDRQSVDLVAPPAQKVVTAHFHFRNRGNRAITIVAAETSCRCVAAEYAHRSYGPGENGEVSLVYTVGDQTGNQEKRIIISTDEPAAQPSRLTLRVVLPDSHATP